MEFLKLILAQKTWKVYRVYIFLQQQIVNFIHNVSMYVHYIRTHIHTYIHTYTHSIHTHTHTHTHTYLYRVSQEERTKLREGVPYVKLYRYNPKHLYPKLNGYGDNGQRSLKI